MSATTSTRERRRNSTHALTTDADTPLFRKGSGNGQNTSRHSAIDHAGYAVSQRLRKRIEKAFGWIRTTNGLRRTRRPGQAGSLFTPTAAACNLVRLPKLLAARGFRR